MIAISMQTNTIFFLIQESDFLAKFCFKKSLKKVFFWLRYPKLRREKKKKKITLIEKSMYKNRTKLRTKPQKKNDIERSLILQTTQKRNYLRRGQPQTPL